MDGFPKGVTRERHGWIPKRSDAGASRMDSQRGRWEPEKLKEVMRYGWIPKRSDAGASRMDSQRGRWEPEKTRKRSDAGASRMDSQRGRWEPEIHCVNRHLRGMAN